MAEKGWMQEIASEYQITKLREMNQYTERYGLSLTEEDAGLLVQERTNSLREQRRVEFGERILPAMIREFCDSEYVTQDNYVETLIRLQDIFYLYKNEMQDEITDEELLHFMKEQFESVCFGDMEYLEGTCLELFSRAIRAGYRGHHRTDGRGEFTKFDEVKRWDRELYLEVLKELCWR